GHGVAPFEPGAELSREPGGFTAQDRIGLHDDGLGPRETARGDGDRVGPGDRTRPADITERILLIFGPRGFLEIDSGRPGVAEVPDVAVHALLPRAPGLDDDGVAAAVRDSDDHAPPLPPLPPPAAAPPFS